MAGAATVRRPPKVVRSYRLVFHRRWRIFRIQNWRIPLPGGLELRAVGYWLACLCAVACWRACRCSVAPACLAAGFAAPAALPLAGAWALSRWEIDGRSPHRALGGLLPGGCGPASLAAGAALPGRRRRRRPARAGWHSAPISGAARYPRGRLRARPGAPALPGAGQGRRGVPAGEWPHPRAADRRLRAAGASRHRRRRTA